MAGVDEVLGLDVRAAMAAIDRLQRELEASLAAAATAGGQHLAQALQRASDATVSPTIDATVNASQITSEINRAADAASVTVDPTVASGGASDVTASIDAAVDAAATSVVIQADANVTGTAEIEGACAAADCVDQGLKDSTESANGLGGVLTGVVGLLAAAGAADFFRDAVNAAADLGETVSKTSVVFGDAADQILELGSTSAEQLGLAQTEALGLAGSLGVLYQGAGLSQQAAADLSAELVGLAGDQASLNNIAGGSAQVVEAFSGALRGEADGVRALGITINEAKLNEIAWRTGIAETGQALNDQQKILATHALLVEQSSIASGDFANTINSLPNQLRILDASFTDTQARIGQGLLPTVSDFVGVLRSDGLPALEALGTSVVPAVITAIQGLIPLFSAGTTVLVALSPVIEQIGLGLQAIPGPAILVVGGVVAMTRAFTAFKASFSLAAITGPQLALAGLAAAVGVVALAMGSGAAEARRHEQAIEGLTGAIYENRDALDTLDTVLSDYLVTAGGFEDADLQAFLRDVGLSTEQLAGQVAEGRDGLEEFLAVIGGGDWDAGQIETIADAFDDASASGIALNGAIFDLTDSQAEALAAFRESADVLEESSQRQATAGVIAGDYTEAQLASAIASTRAADGTESYARALEQIRVSQQGAVAGEQLAAAITAQLATAQETAATAATEQASSLADLRGELDPAVAALQLTGDQMASLTQRLQEGAIPAAEFTRIADQFGVSVDTLAAAEQAATDSLQADLQAQADAVAAWRDALVQSVPDATAAFEGFNEGASIDEALQRFREESYGFLTTQQTLNTLLEGGFTDLATFLATQPPAIIAEFAGKTDEELAAFEASIDESNRILAEGGQVASENAGALAGAVAGGFVDAATGVADADLAGAAEGELSGTAAAVQAQTGSNAEIFIAAREVGSEIPRGVESGLGLTRNGLILAARQIGRDAVDAVAEGAGVHSPSELTMETGKEVTAGLVIGAEQAFSPAEYAKIGATAAAAMGVGFDASAPFDDIAFAAAAARDLVAGEFAPDEFQAIGAIAGSTLAGAFEDEVADLLAEQGLVLRSFITDAQAAAEGVTAGLTVSRVGDRNDFLSVLNRLYDQAGAAGRAAPGFAAAAAAQAEQIVNTTYNINVNEANDAEGTAALVTARIYEQVGP